MVPITSFVFFLFFLSSREESPLHRYSCRLSLHFAALSSSSPTFLFLLSFLFFLSRPFRYQHSRYRRLCTEKKYTWKILEDGDNKICSVVTVRFVYLKRRLFIVRSVQKCMEVVTNKWQIDVGRFIVKCRNLYICTYISNAVDNAASF